MMIKKLITVAVSFAALSGAASARDISEIYTQCGLGAAVFKDYPVVAAISNVSTTWGAPALSSEYSSPETCTVGNKKKTAAFIYDTQTALEQDIAKGKGEYLASLYEVSGCPANSDTTQALREGLATATEGDDRLSRSKTILNSLANSCTL